MFLICIFPCLKLQKRTFPNNDALIELRTGELSGGSSTGVPCDPFPSKTFPQRYTGHISATSCLRDTVLKMETTIAKEGVHTW